MKRPNSSTKIPIHSNLANSKHQKFLGLSLIEMVVAVAIFAILLTGVIGLYNMLVRGVKAGREQTVLANIASSYSEIVRNLPFSQVGTVNGNPSGTLADAANPIVSVIESTTYNIYYEVTWIDDPADGTILLGTDPAPDDYKQVKMSVRNMTTLAITDFVTTVTPKGLEGAVNAGALFIKVFNSQGQPLSGASVHIENLALNPDIILDRTTDSAGNWIEVALPASVSNYHVVVTKNGYSTDQTYPSTGPNPNPTKPDATVAVATVTQISFSIDLTSTLAIKTLDSICNNLSSVGVNLAGSKLIGTNPNVVKYNQNFTSSNGLISLTNLEWDTYIPLLTSNYTVYGTSPIQQVSVLPNSNQTYSMILGPSTPNSLLVIVKDSASRLALEGAAVHLHKNSPSNDYDGITGGSILFQTDWTGGSGQANFLNPSMYFSDDGNIDTVGASGGIRLQQISGQYVSSGYLISSAFDTGAGSSYTTINWNPTSQNPQTILKFQIASNNDNSTWNYIGPDGTAATYYTVSGSTLNNHNNHRYIRYKAYLSTSDNSSTPFLTSVSLNYVTGCATPGQTIFTDLTSGNDYTLDVSLAGYQTVNLSSLNISGNQTLEVLMSP